MNQTTQPRVTPFTGVIFRLLNYIEMIALVVAAVGFAMLYTSMEGAPEMLMVALSTLAGVFFLKGYQPPPVQEQKADAPKPGFIDLLGTTIVPKVGWIACAVGTTGILFRILNLTGNQEMLMIGCTVLTIALVLIGIFTISKPERASGLMPLVYRAVPVCLIGVYLFMKPA